MQATSNARVVELVHLRVGGKPLNWREVKRCRAAIRKEFGDPCIVTVHCDATTATMEEIGTEIATAEWNADIRENNDVIARVILAPKGLRRKLREHRRFTEIPCEAEDVTRPGWREYLWTHRALHLTAQEIPAEQDETHCYIE